MHYMSSTLDRYLDFDRHNAELACDGSLRVAARWLAQELGDRAVVLLGRTDAALMVCAAAAVLRDGVTEVVRAPIGRTGWAPARDSILVEPVAPTPGLIETIEASCPGLEILVIPECERTGSRGSLRAELEHVA